MKLFAVTASMLLLVPFMTMMAGAFEIGGFEIQDGDLKGKYLPAGLDGCTISCYTHKHVLDIVYRKNSIDLTFEFCDDPILKKIMERESLFKEDIKRALMNKTLHINGARVSFEYEGCSVELHDAPTRFMKIYTNKIIISNINHTIQRVKENEIKLIKDNLTGILMSSLPMSIDGNNITCYNDVMLVSFSSAPMKHVENALLDGFMNKMIGGEVTIAGSRSNDTISYFDNVTIKPVIKHDSIVLTVSGDENKGGKVIKVNLAKNVCPSNKMVVKYDGVTIKEADSIEDILNPNDDGSNPEYWVIEDKNGIFMLISIPHFSTHKIDISFIVNNPLFQALAVVAGLAVVAAATIYMFRD